MNEEIKALLKECANVLDHCRASVWQDDEVEIEALILRIALAIAPPDWTAEEILKREA